MQAMIANASRYDWPTWFMGIMRSFISGGAGAIAAPAGPMIMDAKDYNLADGLHKVLATMAIAFFISGLTAMGIFLKTHGAPDPFQKSLADAAKSSAATTAAISDASASAQTMTDSNGRTHIPD